PFIKSLKHAEEKGEFPVYPCPECGAPMDLKVGRMGRFLGCSRYPDCKGTSPLPKIQEKMEEKKEPEIAEGVECPECGKPMAIRDSRFGRFLGCVDYPNCKGTLPISTGVTCPKCKQGELVEKYSPKSRKNFWGCSRYPDCDQISNYQPIDEECPECGHYYLEKRFRKADGGWEPYKRCPECKSKFDMEGEKAEEE
ncbi:MAG: topoisomerase DNA-binding C4 zinc finger domain-containing protein, partial [Candidatus Kapaibacterium sp.]